MLLKSTEIGSMMISEESPTAMSPPCGVPASSLTDNIRAAWGSQVSLNDVESNGNGLEPRHLVANPAYYPPQPGVSECKQLYQDPTVQTSLFFQDSFTCPIKPCSKVFTSSKSYKLHRVKVHRLARHICVVCAAPFHIYKELTDHMSKENHLVYCILCRKVFKRPCEAERHFGLKHRLFRCLYCSSPIFGRDDYRSHILSAHSVEESAFFPSSYVETEMNSSFSESASREVFEVLIVPDIQEVSLLEHDGKVTEIEEVDMTVSEERGSKSAPIEVEDNSNPPPDSTTTFPENCVAAPSSVDVSTNLCSDTDTAEVEVLSDTDTAATVTSSNEIVIRDTSFPQPLISNELDSHGIFFGPGAVDLLDDSPDVFDANISTAENTERDPLQWIGHNVDMYQELSEKHNKIYRYKCGKCSQAYKTKDMLKKHANIHEHVCKCCFLHFDSMSEYKKHMIKHKSAKSGFLCTVCGHCPKELKSLMVHEMRHRLNLAFKRRMDEIAPSREMDRYECSQCKELFQSFSFWMRHEVWHNWSNMWTSYVVGRIFNGTFRENDAINLREAVENELNQTWAHCSFHHKYATQYFRSKQHSEPQTGRQHGACDFSDKLLDGKDTGDVDESSLGETQANSEDKLLDGKDTGDVDESSLGETQANSEDESDAESEASEEGISVAIKGWMSYWCSYLGLDKNPPSWVKPILRKLRSQWNTTPDEHCEMYRQMDQIAILIRSQRNGTSLEGPRVVLRRLPSTSVAQKVSGGIASQNLTPNNVKAIHSQNTNTSNSCRTLNKAAPLSLNDRSLRNVKSAIPVLNGQVRKTLISQASGKVNNTPTTSKLRKRHRSAEVPADHIASTSSAPACSTPSDIFCNMPVVKLMKLSDQCSARSPASLRDLRRTLTSQASHTSQEPKSPVSLGGANSIEEEKNTASSLPISSKHIQSSDEKKTEVPGPPLAIKECNLGIKSPVVILNKLEFASPKSENKVETSNAPVSPILGIKQPRSGSSLPCSRLQMSAWVSRKTGKQPIPTWALPLIDSVSSNTSLSQVDIVNKLHQIVHLINVQRGDYSAKPMPFIPLYR